MSSGRQSRPSTIFQSYGASGVRRGIISYFAFRWGAEKQNDITLRVECCPSQPRYFVRIYSLLVFCSCVQQDGLVFHCRPLNGNGKNIYLCVLCASSEAPVIAGTSGRWKSSNLPALLPPFCTENCARCTKKCATKPTFSFESLRYQQVNIWYACCNLIRD